MYLPHRFYIVYTPTLDNYTINKQFVVIPALRLHDRSALEYLVHVDPGLPLELCLHAVVEEDSALVSVLGSGRVVIAARSHG